MSTTATLEYSVTAFGPMLPATLEAALAAVALDEQAIQDQTGCTFNSDTTTLVGATASRTIVFNINTATFEANFPAGSDQACPFRGLYSQTISGALATFVTETPVVIV